MHRTFNFLLPILVSVCCLSTWVHAQEADKDIEIPEIKKATFAFDINVEKFLDSELIKAVGKENLSQMLRDFSFILPPSIKLETITQIEGVFSLDFDFNIFAMREPPAGDEFPFGFYLKIQFTDEEPLKSLLSEMEGGPSSPLARHMHHGKEYFGPPKEESLPQAVRDLRFFMDYENKFFEIGSSKYVYQVKSGLMNEKVAELWAQLPEDRIVRVAIDAVNSENYINSFLQLLSDDIFDGSQFSDFTKPITDAVKNIEHASGTFDLENNVVVDLDFQANSEEAAKTLRGLGDGLVFMGKLPLKNLVNMIQGDTEESSKILHEIVDQLRFSQEGKSASITIKKPAEFDEVFKTVYAPLIKEALYQMRIRDNLRSAATACQRYKWSTDGRHYPFNRSEKGEEWSEELSWRCRILEHRWPRENLDIDIHEGPAHENNKMFAEKMPSFLGEGKTLSNIRWIKSRVTTAADVTNDWETLMLIRVPEEMAVPWMEADSISIIQVIKLVKNLKDDEEILAATYDAQLITLTNKLGHQELKNMMTPNSNGDR